MCGWKYLVMAIKFQWMDLKSSSFSNCNFLNPVLRAPWYYPQKPQEAKETDFRISLSCRRVVTRNEQEYTNIVLETTPKRIVLQYPSRKKRKKTAQGEQRRLTALRITACKTEGFGCLFSQGSFGSPVPTDLRSHDSQGEHIWHHITNPQWNLILRNFSLENGSSRYNPSATNICAELSSSRDNYWSMQHQHLRKKSWEPKGTPEMARKNTEK